MGIAPEDEQRIFAPYQRAVSEVNYSGFGLGLWMVNQIVDAHGGILRLKSAPNAGTAVTVRLPLRQQN